MAETQREALERSFNNLVEAVKQHPPDARRTQQLQTFAELLPVLFGAAAQGKPLTPDFAPLILEAFAPLRVRVFRPESDPASHVLTERAYHMWCMCMQDVIVSVHSLGREIDDMLRAYERGELRAAVAANGQRENRFFNYIVMKLTRLKESWHSTRIAFDNLVQGYDMMMKEADDSVQRVQASMEERGRMESPDETWERLDRMVRAVLDITQVALEVEQRRMVFDCFNHLTLVALELDRELNADVRMIYKRLTFTIPVVVHDMLRKLKCTCPVDTHSEEPCQ